MKLVLVRDSFSSSSTDGVLFVNSRPFCNTLEPIKAVFYAITALAAQLGYSSF